MLKQFLALSCGAAAVVSAASLPSRSLSKPIPLVLDEGQYSNITVPDYLKPGHLASTDNSSIQSRAPEQIPYWSTTAYLYIARTGSDPGSTCEIRGTLQLTGKQNTANKAVTRRLSVDLPVSKYYGEGINGYEIARILDFSTRVEPADIFINVFEEGNVFQGGRTMIYGTIGWNDYYYPQWNSGRWYVVEGEVEGYKASIVYKVDYKGSWYEE